MPLFDQDTLIQSSSIEITTSTTTSSLSFVDLLTITLTTGNNFVLLWFSSSSCTTAANYIGYDLTVDGTTVVQTAFRDTTANVPSAAAMVFKTDLLSEGSHVFKVRWLLGTSSGVASIDPSTGVQHAILIAEEVTV